MKGPSGILLSAEGWNSFWPPFDGGSEDWKKGNLPLNVFR